MTDLISRQDAIDAIEHDMWDLIEMQSAIDIINKLPSAQRKGRWILHQDSRTWECSECHKYQVIHSDYCMHCGARMVRGEKDGL